MALTLGQQPQLPNINQQAQPVQQPLKPVAGQQASSLGQGTFSAGSNLINAQINPTDSARTQSATGMTDQAAQGLAGYKQPTWTGVQSPNNAGVLGQLGSAYGQTQQMSAAGYNPVAGTDLTGARQQLGMAAGAANGTNPYTGMGQTGGFGYGADTSQVRAMGLDQLNKTLNTTPDRAALASSAFNRIAADSAPQFQQDLRATSALNAALGRKGSGLLTNNLASVQDERNRYLASQQGQLADNAAGLALQDQAAKLAAAQGFGAQLGSLDQGAGSLNLGYQNSNNSALNDAFGRANTAQQNAFGNRLSLANAEANFGQIGRQDATQERQAQIDAQKYGNDILGQKAAAGRQYANDQYGIGQDAYNQAVNERDKGFNAGQVGFQNQRQLLVDLSGYEGNSRANDANAQNALRGERNYQYGLSQDAQLARERQNQQQEQQFQQGFNNSALQTQLGYGASPYSAMTNQANNLSAQGANAMSAGANLLGQYGISRGAADPASGLGPLPGAASVDYGAGLNAAGIDPNDPYASLFQIPTRS